MDCRQLTGEVVFEAIKRMRAFLAVYRTGLFTQNIAVTLCQQPLDKPKHNERLLSKGFNHKQQTTNFQTGIAANKKPGHEIRAFYLSAYLYQA